MSSGISVEDSCLTAFQELKLRKRYRYIVYSLSPDNTSIVASHLSERPNPKDSSGSIQNAKDDYAQFVKEHLPENDCRYAVYDFEFERGPGEGTRNKICFIVWSPDTAKVKSKMLYASSKDAIRKKLVGIANEIQATDAAEVSYDTVLDRVRAI